MAGGNGQKKRGLPMKIFIVFLGFLLVGIHFLCFQQELGKYLLLQETLKQTAEECAIQAALLVEEEALMEGSFVFVKNQTDSQEYFQQVCHKMGFPPTSHMTLEYEDDFAGYQEDNEKEYPRVTVKVEVPVGHLFRTNPFRNSVILRSSCYEVM
jgi:hypothetical protein